MKNPRLSYQENLNYCVEILGIQFGYARESNLLIPYATAPTGSISTIQVGHHLGDFTFFSSIRVMVAAAIPRFLMAPTLYLARISSELIEEVSFFKGRILMNIESADLDPLIIKKTS